MSQKSNFAGQRNFQKFRLLGVATNLRDVACSKYITPEERLQLAEIWQSVMCVLTDWQPSLFKKEV